MSKYQEILSLWICKTQVILLMSNKKCEKYFIKIAIMESRWDITGVKILIVRRLKLIENRPMNANHIMIKIRKGTTKNSVKIIDIDHNKNKNANKLIKKIKIKTYILKIKIIKIMNFSRINH